MGKVTRNRTADRDLDAIVLHIAADSMSAAMNWLTEIQRVFQILADHPNASEAICSPRLGNVRRHTVGSYVIYYRAFSSGVRIVRVLHGARDHRRLL